METHKVVIVAIETIDIVTCSEGQAMQRVCEVCCNYFHVREFVRDDFVQPVDPSNSLSQEIRPKSLRQNILFRKEIVIFVSSIVRKSKNKSR